ncbi:MAG TPA: PIG-L family deacetylase [Candidatus Saccharimonadales bacterium]|nr:PIG-L family deacetylase [Candidatus Saccharimonadales bacterium]
MRLGILSTVFTLLGLFLGQAATSQEPKSLPLPDDRFKTDVLLVVAHPDDEGAATPYLARAMDEGKRVAVVFGTRGSNGGNEYGAEQARALGAIREIEARKALAIFGINNVWFLDGKDTAGQNVLQSLANWGHGESLEQLVRLVRLTRPEVVMTFLPGTFIGEDHGDHQASGVLATEAFDLAGDSTVFPEQVTGPTKRLEAFFENLRPWQPKKIYYFPDADREDIFSGLGPAYSVKEISKSSKKTYWRMAVDSYLVHQTQSKRYSDSIAKMSDAQLEASSGWGDAQHFVLGKSLVGGKVTGDIFERITPDTNAFSPVKTESRPPQPELAVELAGPWGYYADFRRAHALTHLPHPEPPEIALQGGTTLLIPLWLRNQTAKSQEITLTVDLPSGWTVASGDGRFAVAAQQTAAGRIEVNLPAFAESASRKTEAREVTVHAESGGKSVGTVKLRVEVRKKALPE